MIFDKEGEGFIRKTSVEKILEESGHKEGGGHALSDQRWSEMDWDRHGTIDFGEFVFTFSSWVDVDEE